MTSSDFHARTEETGCNRGSVRQIRDGDGRTWTVRELVLTYDRRQTSSLVFSTDEVMRRVREYPSNWGTLSDVELYALSLRC